ncbi:cell wall protein PhiA [Aspergillus undulatus]|uniref:cell wall protein PhiA n=1 Tax=Aspergillus undulatus TaxID=1810928 RepID=UPI003CCC90A0
MKFTSFALAASLAAGAAAQPTSSFSAEPSSTSAPSTPETFGVVAIHSGNAVQYSGFNAALGSLFAGLPNQNASCEGSDSGSATFYVKDEALYLYGPGSQQFYVDRSGMGQGNIGYTTGDASSGPRNGERTGWAINENNHLQFAGNDFIACPNSIDGAYSIWAPSGIDNPAGNSNCVGIAARVVKTDSPVSCTYSS